MLTYAAAICVGPDDRDLDRVADLIESLRIYDVPKYFVMVDDAPELRNLEKRFDFPAGCTAVSVRHPKRTHPEKAAQSKKGKGICSAVQSAMQWIARNATDTRFTLKFDTDALVIAPFSEKIAAFFDEHPTAGIIGAYDFTPNGDVRDISKNGRTIEALYRHGSLMNWIKSWFVKNERTIIRQHIGMALDHGYVFGEHCLGGAYAVSNELIRRMNEFGYLDDPTLWLPIDCPEDVMMGIYNKASGLTFKGYVADNQAFGIRHKGLPDILPRLIERGFSIIHSTKDYGHVKEDEIRGYFKEIREKASDPTHARLG